MLLPRRFKHWLEVVNYLQSKLALEANGE